MDSVRKKIINRSLLREKQPLLQSPIPPRNKESKSAKKKKPDIRLLEDYIDEICSSIASNSSLSSNIIAKSSEMSEFLDRCLQELPDFSLQFYVLMSNILKRISDIQSEEDIALISNYLLELSDFLQIHKCEGGLLEDIQKKALEFDIRIISEFASLLKNKEPYKSIALAFLHIYSSVDPQIFRQNNSFASKAIKFLREYLKSPLAALSHFKSTHKYISSRKISKGNNYSESIENAGKLLQYEGPVSNSSTKKIYDFLVMVLKYCSHENGPELESTANFNGVYQQIDQQPPTFDTSEIVDELFENIENFDCKETRAKSPFVSCLNESVDSFGAMSKSTMAKQSSSKDLDIDEDVRDKLKKFLSKFAQSNPKANLLAAKNKLLNEFEMQLNWNQKKAAKVYRRDLKFRSLAMEIQKHSVKSFKRQMTWRQKQILYEKDKLNSRINKYNKK